MGNFPPTDFNDSDSEQLADLIKWNHESLAKKIDENAEMIEIHNGEIEELEEFKEGVENVKEERDRREKEWYHNWRIWLEAFTLTVSITAIIISTLVGTGAI